MDVMGPTLDQVAQAFTTTIPYNGYLITVDGPYFSYFEAEAKKRHTKVIIADNSKIPEGFLEQFDYTLFPENVSLALAVAEALEINRDTALQGCLNAHPDPGAMRLHHLQIGDKNTIFVNGFAANEPSSTFNIWERVCEDKSIPTENPIILFNGRPDRIDRTEQFVKDFFPHFKGGTLIGMGSKIRSIEVGFEDGAYGFQEYKHLEDKSAEEILNILTEMVNNRVIFGIGNIHGDGEELIEKLLSYKTSKKNNVLNIVELDLFENPNIKDFSPVLKKIKAN